MPARKVKPAVVLAYTTVVMVVTLVLVVWMVGRSAARAARWCVENSGEWRDDLRACVVRQQ